MRLLVLCLLLLLPVLGAPTTARSSGKLVVGKPFKLQGKLFAGQATFQPLDRGYRLHAVLPNKLGKKARCGLHVAVYDARGQLLASRGETLIIPVEAGKNADFYFDFAIPKASLRNAARYEAVLYEDTALLGIR